MVVTPPRTKSFFIIFLLKNSALSGGVSVGGEGEGGDASDVKWCERDDPSKAECCDGANPSGSVVARSDPVSCGDGGISDNPELEG